MGCLIGGAMGAHEVVAAARLSPAGRRSIRRELDDFIFGVADSFEVAFHATRLARLADPAAMPDELMREGDPFVFGDDAHKILLDFFGIRVASEVQPAGEA